MSVWLRACVCKRDTGTYDQQQLRVFCSCFWDHRKFIIFLTASQTFLLRGAVLFTTGVERTEEGCSCPSLHAFQVEQKRAEEMWGETLVLLAFVKRHRGGSVCGAANTMRWIFFAINLSRSAVFSNLNTKRCNHAVELFYKEALLALLELGKVVLCSKRAKSLLENVCSCSCFPLFLF